VEAWHDLAHFWVLEKAFVLQFSLHVDKATARESA